VHLERLHIQGLRNIAEASLELGPGFNYLYGQNGAGKTAVLEAIYLLARGRSFRARNINQLVSQGAVEMLIRAELSNAAGLQRMGFSRRLEQQSSVSTFSLNGQVRQGFSVLATELAVQTLLPDAAELVYGAPGERRRFLDWGLFHVKQNYLGLSRRYHRTLQQRNAWLKTVSAGDGLGEKADPWLQQLLEAGKAVSVAREEYVRQLEMPFTKALNSLSGDMDVHLDYAWGGLASEAEYGKKMSESFARDVKFGMTHRGPHRADLSIIVEDEGGGVSAPAKTSMKAGERLSRGQAKVTASALMLAQVALQRESVGQGSVVLIDDLGAELDAAHWRRFLVTLEQLGCQVIATSTQPPDKQGWLTGINCDVFHVEQGAVSRLQSEG